MPVSPGIFYILGLRYNGHKDSLFFQMVTVIKNLILEVRKKFKNEAGDF